jgi:His/Glu/Gln/Arg/opine family amino acid ABC transporter permease subunit
LELLNLYIMHLTKAAPALLKGAVLTIQITALSVFFGTIIGLVVGLGRLSPSRLLARLASVYVDVIRGTPLLVQVFIIYFGIPGLLTQLTEQTVRIAPQMAAIIACSINSGAYVAEIFRAGIQSVEKGQMEAARSLGMTRGQAMRYVILPQAFRRVVPPLGNEFIALMKDTSILSAIGVEELVRKGQLYVAATYQPFPIYMGIALVYLVLTLTISRWVAYTERRLGVK